MNTTGRLHTHSYHTDWVLPKILLPQAEVNARLIKTELLSTTFNNFHAFQTRCIKPSRLVMPLHWPNFSTKKLSSIEDRGQTDRVTALPLSYTLDTDLWPWPMTLTFNPRRARSWSTLIQKLTLKVSRFKRYSGNKLTDGRMLPIALYNFRL